MNYCKHLKKRKNKPYCKLLDKEITFSCCQECDNKEYKINNKKSTIFVKNGTFYTKNAQNNKKNVQNFLQSSAKTLQKMKNKSNKLAKLERKRFSVFTNNMDKCFFCDNPRMDKHEIYRGKNRTNSMKFGFVLPMCRFHHDIYQDDILFNKYWHEVAQKYYEENIGTREEFIKIFKRNYID